VQLLHGPVLDDGHACLLRGPVDQDVLHVLGLIVEPMIAVGLRT
jgi:hypothetical protein